MSIIRTFSNNFPQLEFDGQYIRKFGSGEPLYEVRGKTIVNYKYGVSGQPIFEQQDRGNEVWFNHFRSAPMYTYDGQYVKSYRSGIPLFEIRGSTVVDYKTGKPLITIQGVVPKIVLAFLLTQ